MTSENIIKEGEEWICVGKQNEAFAVMSDKDRQKVCEVGLQSVCQTVECCLSSLSSLHHPLPIHNHTLLRGGSFLLSPAACKKLAQRTKGGGGEGGWGKRGGVSSDTQSLHPAYTKLSSGASAQLLV